MSYFEKQKIVLKFDDLRTISDNVKRLDNIINEQNLKVSWGIVGKSLKNRDVLYDTWIKDRNKSGLYEFFNHGYNHSSNPYEFLDSTLRAQINSIYKTQKLALKRGIVLRIFGAPANKIDENTSKALGFFPEIKGWFFGNNTSCKFIFDRTIEIEFPCGHVNFDKFKQQYINRENANLIIYQGHPDMWSNYDFDEFIKIIQYLKEDGVEFCLPKEVLKTKTYWDLFDIPFFVKLKYFLKIIPIMNSNIFSGFKK